MSWDRFVFASDNHGDMVDPSAASVLFRFLQDWKPKIRIHGGDNFDLRALRKKASEEEKRESLSIDFAKGMEFLETFDPTHFLRGNHDERLWDLAKEKRGPISDYGRELTKRVVERLHRSRSVLLPYDRRAGVLRVGSLKALHGYCTGVNAARRLAQAYGSCVSGHAHSIQSASIEGVDNRVGRIVGCLCDLDMDYSRAVLGSLVHRHGFAYGVVDSRSGDHHVWQAEEINGHWMLPSDVISYGGKR